ncbi:MAG: glycosyltransferase family 9 protein, partial [Mailhella sp.]|nr:glycosyltransferase family 9 protein [Mailhella sp.]
DVLLATPVFRLLHERFPRAELHLFTEEKCVPLLRGNPFISGFHAIDKGLGLPGQLAFYRSVARVGFDLAINFQQLPRCCMMTLFSGARVRLSPRCGIPRRWLYTHTAETVPGYACQTKASLLAPLGIAWDGEGPEIFLTDGERREAAALLASAGLRPGARLVSIDPTHRRATKRWPAERWAQMIALLSGQEKDAQFLLMRGPGEDSEIEHLRALCLGLGVDASALLVPPSVPGIRLSAACLAGASLHIGGCSAPRHMAAALGVPSLVIPGASGPEWRYPSPMHRELRPALPCRPCSRTECSDPQCLLRVSAQDAAEAALGMLRGAEDQHM